MAEDTTDFVSIRAATPDDAGALVKMMLPFNAEEGVETSEGALEAGVAALLAGPGGALIAEVGGVPSGYAAYSDGFDIEFGGRLGVLNELWVVPRHRGKGVGRRLIAAAEAALVARGAAAMQLLVRPDNGGAQSLYRHHDFNFDPRLLMTKRLSPPG